MLCFVWRYSVAIFIIRQELSRLHESQGIMQIQHVRFLFLYQVLHSHLWRKVLTFKISLYKLTTICYTSERFVCYGLVSNIACCAFCNECSCAVFREELWFLHLRQTVGNKHFFWGIFLASLFVVKLIWTLIPVICVNSLVGGTSSKLL